MLCCPCCNETLSASHQCEIPNISDVSSDSNIHKTDNNQMCTPTPDHNRPPSAPSTHSLKHPNPEPPDVSTSTSSKTNEINIDNLLRAFNVVLNKRFSKPKQIVSILLLILIIILNLYVTIQMGEMVGIFLLFFILFQGGDLC